MTILHASRGVIIIGDERWASDAVRLAESAGWPILAEPAANVHSAHVIAYAPLLLTPEVREYLAPEVVVTFGRFGLSRPVTALVRAAAEHIAISRDASVDPFGTATARLSVAPTITTPAPDSWLAAWQAVSACVGRHVDALQEISDLTVVREVGRTVTAGHAVLIAASRAVRDAEATWNACPARVFMNRGTNGIDGLVSTAWGIAIGSGCPTVAVLGDLAFLHDINGLLARDGQAWPSLTYVVIDNNGGGIFSSLEQGAPAFATHFERLFGTPHNLDLVDMARAHGVPAQRVTSLADLATALTSPDLAEPVRVLVVSVGDREAEQRRHTDLRSAIAQDLSAWVAQYA